MKLTGTTGKSHSSGPPPDRERAATPPRYLASATVKFIKMRCQMIRRSLVLAALAGSATKATNLKLVPGSSPGAYTVQVGGSSTADDDEIWFTSGATQFTSGNKTMSTADGSLKLVSHTTGSGAMGIFPWGCPLSIPALYSISGMCVHCRVSNSPSLSHARTDRRRRSSVSINCSTNNSSGAAARLSTAAPFLRPSRSSSSTNGHVACSRTNVARCSA